jgi:hypothetical protein
MDRMIRESCEHVCEPSLRLDVVELASLNQCIGSGCTMASGVRAREGPVLLDRQIRPSSRKRVKATQRLRM